MSHTTLEEPVRRYFDHALGADARDACAVHLTMAGRIKVGRWLSFSADWEGDGRSFTWRARAAHGLLRVVDHYAGPADAGMNVRLLGRLGIVDAHDADTVRSAAGRAAIEAAFWAPMALRPERAVDWRAVSDEEIVAAWDVAPERPEVHLRIAPDGANRDGRVMRWKDATDRYVACGGEVGAERSFGDLTIPSRVRVGWWFGTERYEPFFEAAITEARIIRASL